MTPQPMSRRQRREAERAAEAARQVAEAQVAAAPSSPSTTHTTHVAGATRRSRRDLHADNGAASSPLTAPNLSALPDVPLAPQKQNHPQRPVAPAAASDTRTGARPGSGSVPSVPAEPAPSQPVAPMSRMARRRQSAIEQPEPTSHQPEQPQASAPQGYSSASAAPSVFSPSAQVAGDTRPTRRSRKDLRTAQVFEDTQHTRENPAVESAAQPQAHRPEDHSESRHDQRRSHRGHQAAPAEVPSTPSALSPLVAASLAESASGLGSASAHPTSATPWWAASDTASASPSDTQRHRHAAAQTAPAEPEAGATSEPASRSAGRRRQRASAAAPAGASTASTNPVVASTPHHAASFGVPGTQTDGAATQTPRAEASAPVELAPQAPSAPETPHEIRFSQRITDFRGAETIEVPEVRKIMVARKAGVPLADEETIHAIKAARSARKTKSARTAAQAKRGKAADEAAAPTSSVRAKAASKPDTHRDSSTGPTPARPVRRRTGSGILGRTAVLSVLAMATVLAPLSSHLDNTPLASAAMKMHPSGSTTQSPAAAGTKASSVASAVLGSDDLDDDSDTQLSNVPDAATRARIREAYQNAAKTCSSATGASGDTSAFSSKPQLFYPMLPGTYEISSEYGYRTHPTLGYRKLHAGQDMAAPVGTPIYAAAAGTVTTAGMVDGTGTITIKHEIDGQVWYTSYLHMYEDGIYVKAGDTVTAGQMIAGVGNTGRSSGSHLHFEVRTKDDTADESTVEPWGWLKQHNAVELTTNCS
ncbi:M23 family metallopeptidase [Actinomyces oris]|uniref:Peptidoglycan DD-metalloendopeptidase family protein n=1 Tax=Actinomyces oris TaxID=544580 RepID=A0AAW9KNL2_9ACTO|nr:peptidoglycan DD-metalloendopeptidase family protein [Actinomyces oris]MEA1306011.1 peptidoglycan DD-metalloendopeptidase family protein [Actinomyces oris]